jgi:hypothetical protein
MRRARRVQLTALVAMIGVFTLGGCGKYYWSKPGSTRDQFDADSTGMREGGNRLARGRPQH